MNNNYNDDNSRFSSFKNPRINARTSKALGIGTEEDLEREFTVEATLDFIFGAICEKIENIIDNEDSFEDDDDVCSHMYVDVKVECEDRTLFNEVLNRLVDYGYQIQFIAGDEEDQECMENMEKMALEDETVAKVLRDLEDSIDEFRVSWHTIID